MGRARLADVTAGPLAEVCVMECPLVFFFTCDNKITWCNYKIENIVFHHANFQRTNPLFVFEYICYIFYLRKKAESTK